MSNLEYFGTNTQGPGHYRWNVGMRSLENSSLNFLNLPFNPERLPYGGRLYEKGRTEFKIFNEWTVLAISGSPVDKRGGSKSVFFIKEVLTKEQMIEKIKSNSVAMDIISKMPFEINWDDTGNE